MLATGSVCIVRKAVLIPNRYKVVVREKHEGLPDTTIFFENRTMEDALQIIDDVNKHDFQEIVSIGVNS